MATQPVALLFLNKSDPTTRYLSAQFLKWLRQIPGLAKEIKVLNTDELVVDEAIELDKLPIIETFQTSLKENGDQPVLLKGIPDAFLWLIEISKSYCGPKTLIPGQLEREIKGFLNNYKKPQVEPKKPLLISNPYKIDEINALVHHVPKSTTKKKSPIYGAVPLPDNVPENLDESPIKSSDQSTRKISKPALSNSFVVPIPGDNHIKVAPELLTTPWRRRKLPHDEDEIRNATDQGQKDLSNGRNIVKEWHDINGSLKTPIRCKIRDPDETNMQLEAESKRIASMIEKSLEKEGIQKQTSIGIKFNDAIRMTPRTQKKLQDEEQQSEYAKILQINKEREMILEKTRALNNPNTRANWITIPKSRQNGPDSMFISQPPQGRGIGIRFPSKSDQ